MNKESNPKDACGVKKVPLHVVPVQPLFELGLAMLEGARKYGAHNYRSIGVRASTYYDACMRHLMSWWEGEDIDPDSGVPHIIKAVAGLFVLRDAQCMGLCEDDRPIRYTSGLDMEELNDGAWTIIHKYPDCKEPFTARRKLSEIIGDEKPIDTKDRDYGLELESDNKRP